ncbi:MAG: phosphate ABC transporter permease subunit PstC [Jatrophihabitans sp.]|uniref:phosphate ABC transporter permease subunit PstC n=1 Tax=Jatrophihabitans sp. TaxID=1932789 RepID=UPI003F80050C
MTSTQTTVRPSLDPAAPPDDPRRLDATPSRGDLIYRNVARLSGWAVMLLTGSIGIFLGYELIPTVNFYGLNFFTETDFNPEKNVVGVASAVVGSIEIAVIALLIAFPLALVTALFISEYAPARVKSLLVSLVDLMAAIPSIVYAIWGSTFLMPHLLFVARWLNEWFGWLPFFAVHDADPRAAQLAQFRYEQSAFCAGVVVALMVIPIACAVMRNVFSQAPLGEREGAYALGATKWGLIRAVVLPYGRGGIIGGMMLGLGRALGETVVVLLIISLVFDVKIRILESGTVTISALIADRVGTATSTQFSALLAAGFVLFVMTLVVNTLASIIVSRSRSGAGVDL